ncbi:MAG TPA: radical SAM protein [Rhodospirillales bacterium]|nr:radical SAM protein [Rhodospirillales bacterium]
MLKNKQDWDPSHLAYKRDPDDVIGAVKGSKFDEYRKRWKRITQSLEHPEFPIHIDFELSHSCNLKCPMCTWSVDFNKNSGKSSWVSLETFKRVIEEGVADGLCAVGLNAVNEPLIRPDLPEFVQVANDAGIIDIMFHTNGLLLTEEMSERLIDSGLTRLMVSLDAVTQETYDKIRVGGNMEKTKRNIFNFLRIRSDKGLTLPVLSVNFVKMAINEHELHDFVDYWKEHVDYFVIQQYMNPLPEDENQNELYSREYESRLGFKCPEPFQRLKLSAAGNFFPCCSLYGDDNANTPSGVSSTGEQITVGKLGSASIKEIWHGEEMENLRSLHKNGHWHEHPICNLCVRNTYVRDLD